MKRPFKSATPPPQPFGSAVTRWALLSTLPFALSSSGCSFLFVDGPKIENATGCTDSVLWPVVDYAIAGLQGVRTVYAASSPDSAYEGARISKEADIVLGSSLLVLFASSAIVGTMRVRDCKDSIGRNSDPDLDRELHERARRLQKQRQQQKNVEQPARPRPAGRDGDDE